MKVTHIGIQKVHLFWYVTLCGWVFTDVSKERIAFLFTLTLNKTAK